MCFFFFLLSFCFFYRHLNSVYCSMLSHLIDIDVIWTPAGTYERSLSLYYWSYPTRFFFLSLIFIYASFPIIIYDFFFFIIMHTFCSGCTLLMLLAYPPSLVCTQFCLRGSLLLSLFVGAGASVGRIRT